MDFEPPSYEEIFGDNSITPMYSIDELPIVELNTYSFINLDYNEKSDWLVDFYNKYKNETIRTTISENLKERYGSDARYIVGKLIMCRNYDFSEKDCLHIRASYNNKYKIKYIREYNHDGEIFYIITAIPADVDESYAVDQNFTFKDDYHIYEAYIKSKINYFFNL